MITSQPNIVENEVFSSMENQQELRVDTEKHILESNRENISVREKFKFVKELIFNTFRKSPFPKEFQPV
jgi:hypothetical protein